MLPVALRSWLTRSAQINEGRRSHAEGSAKALMLVQRRAVKIDHIARPTNYN